MSEGGSTTDRSRSPASRAKGSPLVAAAANSVAAAASSTSPDASVEQQQQQHKQQQNGGDGGELLSMIGRLKEEQAGLRAQRKKVQLDLKKAERRRSRLKNKARQLTDTDLLTVLQMRESKKTEDQTGNDKKATVPSKGGENSEGAK